MRFTIQRIHGIAPVMVFALLLTPAMGLAQVKPDLKVTSLTGVPATARPGDSFVTTATVQNQGAGAAGVSITKFELISTTGGPRKNLNGVQNIPGLAGCTAAPCPSAAPPVSVSIYSETLPGQYVVRACANNVDPKIVESATANNCLLSGPITVQDVPNLAMTAMFEPPPSFKVPQGQPFLASYTVENTREVPSAQFLVRFVLKAGTTRINLKTDAPETVAFAGKGQFTNPALKLTVKGETAPGVYLLEGCADYGKTVPEPNEDDNCKTSGATVEVTPQPDLFLKEATVTGATAIGPPLSVGQGNPLEVKVVVKNLSLLRDAGKSVLKLVLVSTGATPLSKNLKAGTWKDVDPVLKNTEVTINATPIVYDETVPGNYRVQACIDSEKDVDEILESNNCAFAPGTVTVVGVPLSPADYEVTELLMPPLSQRSVFPGQGFPLTPTILNHGTGATSVLTTIKFYVVDAANLRTSLKGVQPIVVDPVAVGELNAKKVPVTVQVYPGTAPGSYRVQACADGKKQLREGDEDDNCFTSATGDEITVRPAPDLVVLNVGDPPATSRPGQTFTVSQTQVQNIGLFDAPASEVRFFLVSTVDATIRFDMDGSLAVPPLGSTALSPIDPGTPVKVGAETLPGPYKVQACADGGKVVFEGDEDRNCTLSAGQVQVGAAPDLIVNEVKPPPATAARGATVSLTAVVKNQGLAEAGASSLRFSLVVATGAAQITKLPGIASVPKVAANGGLKSVTGPVTIPTGTPVGTYFVQACVDTGKVVEEISDANNCGTSLGSIEVQ